MVAGSHDVGPRFASFGCQSVVLLVDHYIIEVKNLDGRWDGSTIQEAIVEHRCCSTGTLAQWTVTFVV
jgi:hypothetical protein